MSDIPPLAEQPDMLLELLAIMVKRAGGSVRLGKDDDLPPFVLRQTLIEDDAGDRWMVLEYDESPVGRA